MRALWPFLKIALMITGALAIAGWAASYAMLRFWAPDITVSYAENQAPDGSAKLVLVTHRDASIPPRFCNVSVYAGRPDVGRSEIVREGRVLMTGDCKSFEGVVSGKDAIWDTNGSLAFPLSGPIAVTGWGASKDKGATIRFGAPVQR